MINKGEIQRIADLMVRALDVELLEIRDTIVGDELEAMKIFMDNLGWEYKARLTSDESFDDQAIRNQYRACAESLLQWGAQYAKATLNRLDLEEWRCDICAGTSDNCECYDYSGENLLR